MMGGEISMIDRDISRKKYKENIAKIIDITGVIEGIKIEQSGRNASQKGSSGQRHQFDIIALIPYEANNRTAGNRVAVQCQYLDQAVTPLAITTLADAIDDCHFNKGIIISTQPFSVDIIALAKERAIELILFIESDDGTIYQKKYYRSIYAALKDEVDNKIADIEHTVAQALKTEYTTKVDTMHNFMVIMHNTFSGKAK